MVRLVPDAPPSQNELAKQAPHSPEAVRPAVIALYEGISGTCAHKATFRISLYYFDLFVKKGILELDFEPTPDLNSRLFIEGLKRIPIPS